MRKYETANSILTKINATTKMNYIKASDILKQFKQGKQANSPRSNIRNNATGNLIKPSRTRVPSRKDSRNDNYDTFNLQTKFPEIRILQEFKSVKQRIDDNMDRLTNYQKAERKLRNIENTKNPRDRQINMQIDQSASMQEWVGCMIQKVTSQAFEFFIKKQISYNEMKILCSSNFLRNIINYVKKKDINDYKVLLKMDETIAMVLQHLCNKYPQSIQREANKRLEQAVQKNMIDNIQDDSYDLLLMAGFTFQYRACKDYTKQIMQFFNYLISMPFTPPGQQGMSRSSSRDSSTQAQNQMAPFKKFELLMNRIFQTVYKKDQGTDFTQVIDFSVSPNNINTKIEKAKTQQERQYMEKVKRYTKILIGTKFSQSTPLFSQQQMQSGNIQIKNSQIIRVLVKWLDQLMRIYQEPEKFFLQRSYRFKGGNNPKQKKKINPSFTKILYQKTIQKGKAFEQFVQNIVGKAYENGLNLCKSQQKYFYDFLPFLDQSQKTVGAFYVQMSTLAQQSLVKGISSMIHGMIQIVKQLREEWLEKNQYFSQSPVYKNLDIDLITFKIGDIMRCKCISRQDQILRIFQVITMISETKQCNLLKIVRVKNRLNQGTRDILINIIFDNKCMCQIQLSVASDISQDQTYFDKFNHFLYELKRSKVGAILQMCSVLRHIDPKAATFSKHIQDQRIRHTKKRFSCAQVCPIANSGKLKTYQLPFICSKCDTLCPYQRSVYPSKINPQNGKIICGQCISVGITQAQLRFFIFQRLSYRIRTFTMSQDQNDQCMTRITDMQQLKKYDTLNLIPINSRLINFHFAFRVQIDDRTFIVTSKLKQDGSGVIYEKKFMIKKQKDVKQFFDTYLVYANRVPFEYKVVDPNTPFANTYVTNKMLQKIWDKGQKVKVGYGATQHNGAQTIILMPYFRDNTDLRTYFQKESNIGKIKKAMKSKKQVIDMSQQTVTDQFNLINKEIKIKLYTTVKQLFLNNNQIQNIDFVSHMNELMVLQANRNLIQKIPQLPESLVQLDLGSNAIRKITGLTSKNKNLKKISFYNNQIEKIQGLDQLPYLQQLYLLRNNISKIENLNNLPRLVRISLATNKITILQNLDKLVSLQYLYISNNKIQNIEQIRKLTWIKTVFFNVLQINKIGEFPQLKNIQGIHMYGNQISKIQHLTHFQNLLHLNLNNNVIRVIEGLQSLRLLEQLHLCSNQISKIQNLQQNRGLKILFLTNNEITQIQNLQSLNNLQFLNLSSNKIEKMQKLHNQFHLVKIFLSDNKIKVVQNIQHITSLQQLRVDNNQVTTIKSIPRKIGKIDLRKNKISSIMWTSQYPSVQILMDMDYIQPEQKNKHNAVQLFVKFHDEIVPSIDMKIKKTREQYLRDVNWQQRTKNFEIVRSKTVKPNNAT